MAFDGETYMASKAQVIGKAAMVRALITAVERRLQDGIDIATAADEGVIAAKLEEALIHVQSGHTSANEAAALIAEHFDEPDVGVFSGGDDKPEDPPEGP